jgi:hypothetical protein
MDDVTVGKSERNFCISLCMVQKKMEIFLAADEWI